MSQPLSIRKGTTQNRDPWAAAQELHDALVQPDTKLVIFYCAADFDLPALATALHARFGDINMIGCTTAGEITPQGYLAGSLTGFSLAGPEFDVRTQAIGLEPFDSTATGGAVARLLARPRPARRPAAERRPTALPSCSSTACRCRKNWW